MLCTYLLISINELLISIISFIDINKYGLNVKTAAHKNVSAVVDVSFRSLAVATHSATGAVGSLPGPWELGPR